MRVTSRVIERRLNASEGVSVSVQFVGNKTSAKGPPKDNATTILEVTWRSVLIRRDLSCMMLYCVN